MSTTINHHRGRHALWVAEMIQKHGHAIISVGTGECSVPGCRHGPDPVSWSYTIGLRSRSRRGPAGWRPVARRLVGPAPEPS